MKIGITGGKGFLGSHVSPVLQEKGYKLDFFENYGSSIENEGAMRRFVKGKDVIIHLAGKNKGSNSAIFRVNVLGTQELLSAIHESSSGAKIIFASSVQAYLDGSFYGLTKKLAENIFRFYAINYHIPCIALRFTNLYGPNGKPFYNSVIATFVHQLKSGTELTVEGDGEEMRDYLYIEDAVDAIVKAVDYKMSERFVTLDVCSGKKYSLKQIVGLLKEKSGLSVSVKYKKKDQNPWRFRVDIKNIQTTLNWAPKVSLAEGIERMLKNEN